MISNFIANLANIQIIGSFDFLLSRERRYYVETRLSTYPKRVSRSLKFQALKDIEVKSPERNHLRETN